jgi:hypothetical protein
MTATFEYIGDVFGAATQRNGEVAAVVQAAPQLVTSISGFVQGVKGDSAFTAWQLLTGNAGKTFAEFLEIEFTTGIDILLNYNIAKL